MPSRAEHALLHDIARIATLHIPDTQRIAEICARLHHGIPSITNSFLWFERTGQVTNFFLDVPELIPASRIYFEQYFGTAIDQQAWTPGIQLIKRGPMVDSTADFGAKWTGSPMYRDLFRKEGVPHMTRVVVGGSGKPGRGMFGLQDDRPLSAADQQTLRRLIPYFNHALDGGGSSDVRSKPGEPSNVRQQEGDLGVLVIDQWGEIVQSNGTAQRLIQLACQDRLYQPGRSSSAHAEGSIEPILRLLRQRLANPIGHDRPQLPEHVIDNVAGRFLFRAERFHSASSHPEGWTCITVRRQLPLPLLWHRAIDRLKLSPVEKHVCLLLLDNLSQPAIAAALKISLHTVVTHVRNLYRKLGVTDRSGLSLVIMKHVATTG